MFCTGDKDENTFNNYFKDMPWETMGEGFEKCKANFSKLMPEWKINGIPCLCLVRKIKGKWN